MTSGVSPGGPLPVAAMPAALSRVLAGRPVVTRFAPSPTGQLHLGHARSAFVGHDLARRLGGRFLLRIEDIDVERCRPELIPPILEALTWLGLTWDGPVLRQSEHLADYAAAAARLAAMGLVYPCFASRAEIEAAATPGASDPDGAPLYPGLCRGMPAAEVARRQAAGEPFAMRLDMGKAMAAAQLRMAAGTGASPDAAGLGFTRLDAHLQPARVPVDPARWGDSVIQRKTVATSYHLSVVVDDARQGVSIVTRGQDLLASTDIHRLLQVLLDLPEPLYLHHELLLGADGRKLSKRDAATSLAALRAGGATPAEVRRLAGLPA